MKTLFAVVALPGTNNPAAQMMHNSLEFARASASYASGQVAELQHRIDRLDTEFLILALAYLLLAAAVWRLHKKVEPRG
jgi:ammonia channel protein AmtB